MFDFVTQWISDSPWTYGIVTLLVMADIATVIPAETVVVTATILALDGELIVWLLYPATVVGALVGDNILFWLGRTVGDPIADRFFTSDRQRERLAWAEQQMERHGRLVIVAARFVPVGRTATVFGAGTLEMPWRKFLVADVVAVCLYSAYLIALGWIGGAAFAHTFWKSFLLSMAVATVVGLAAEGVRRLRERRLDDGEDERAEDEQAA